MAKKVRHLQGLMRKIGEVDVADRELLERFRRPFGELSSDHRLELYRWLAGEVEVDPKRAQRPIEAALGASEGDRAEWHARVRDLRAAVASPRLRALGNLINTTGGMKLLLEMRADVLEAQRQGERGLGVLEDDIAFLLNRWCQHGFLFLEEVNLKSSFQTIRFLKEREMVHPMVSLEEMGQRLGVDRMCFALYHVVMPDEPVVFIEVALSRGLIRSIHDIIDDSPADRKPVKSPDTAVFYSINNTQIGLAGLGLGKVLIVRVTEALRERRPSLKTFATLSPITGFWPRYLRPILEGSAGDGFTLDRPEVVKRVAPKSMEAIVERYRELGGDCSDEADVLREILAGRDWLEDEVFRDALCKPLVDVAHVYLTKEKDARGKPLNPVAGFHLGNGATLSRHNVNYAANTTARGLEDSCGLMANYVYSEKALAPIGRAVRSLLPWGRGGGS
jgi:malonyl-CoA decarboxylase